MSTIQLARGVRLNEEAQAALAAARDLLRQNTDRVNEARARMDEITQRRVGGTSTAAEAAKYSALHGNLTLLAKMLTGAQEAEAQAVERVHGAFIYYSEAKNVHGREQAEARFKALQETCREIDAVLCKALGELGRAGQTIGMSTLGSCFQKSDTLHRALDLNVTPGA